MDTSMGEATRIPIFGMLDSMIRGCRPVLEVHNQVHIFVLCIESFCFLKNSMLRDLRLVLEVHNQVHKFAFLN